MGLSQMKRWALLIFCVAASAISSAGCILLAVGALANNVTAEWSVDPSFAKAHDLGFKQPSVKTKAVLLFESDGFGFGTVSKEPYRDGFLQAVEESGAFFQVVQATNERDLQNYSGWNVIRIKLSWLGEDVDGRNHQFKFRVKVRSELQPACNPTEYVYSSATWETSFRGQPPIDEAHPLMSQDQAAKLFAQEIVLAAFSDDQRAGCYFR